MVGGFTSSSRDVLSIAPSASFFGLGFFPFRLLLDRTINIYEAQNWRLSQKKKQQTAWKDCVFGVLGSPRFLFFVRPKSVPRPVVARIACRDM